MKKIDAHKKIINKLHETYVKKNSDYGDSFGKSFEKYGALAGIIRMEDKWNRLTNLIEKKEVMVGDESVADTLLDLANYSIMLYMELTDEANFNG